MSKLAETRKLALEMQTLVVDAFGSDRTSPAQLDKLLTTVCNTPEEEVTRRLGAVGTSLLHIVKTAIIDHPDILSLTGTEAWEKLSRSSLSALHCTDASERASLEEKYKSSARLLAVIKPRFVKNTETRAQVRSGKTKPIQVNLQITDNENVFFSRPADFSLYLKDSKGHDKLIDEINERRKVFDRKQMPEVAHILSKRVDTLTEAKQQQHLGFFRVKPVDAAIILGRMHFVRWHDNAGMTVPLKLFDDKPFWIDPPQDGNKKPTPVTVWSGGKRMVADPYAFTYQARLYPISAFGDVPQMASAILGAVDNLPEQAGYPAFDYYWLLMPSIGVSHQTLKPGEKFVFRFGEFDDEATATQALDSYLVREKLFTPAVLAERDGSLYYLCMWV